MFWYCGHNRRQRRDALQLKLLGYLASELIKIGNFGSIVFFMVLDELASDICAGLHESLFLRREIGLLRPRAVSVGLSAHSDRELIQQQEGWP